MSEGRITVASSGERSAKGDHFGILRNQRSKDRSGTPNGLSPIVTDNPPKRTSFSENVPLNKSCTSKNGQYYAQDNNNGRSQGKKMPIPKEKRNSMISIDSSITSWNKKLAESCSCLGLSDIALERINAIHRSTVWKLLIAVFTFILLFGSAFEEFCPSDINTFFDALFMITLGVLLVDILMNVFINPKYFNFSMPFTFKFKTGSSHESKSSENMQEKKSFQIGSLLFWFDLISSLSILFEIKFINASSDESTIRYIFVSDDGDPFGIHDYKSLGIYSDADVLLNVIVRTARVARFIRASTVIDFTSKLNLYWCCKLGARRNKYTSIYNFPTDLTPKARNFRTFIGFDYKARRAADDAASTIQRSWRSYCKQRDQTKSPKSIEDGYKKQKKRILKLRKNESLSSDPPSRRQKSQIGAAMNDITMSRIALGIIISVTVAVLFTYHEVDPTTLKTMTVLHNTMVSVNDEFCSEISSAKIQSQKEIADSARETSTPHFYDFSFTYTNCTYDQRIFYDESSNTFQELTNSSGGSMKPREKHILEVHICGSKLVPSHGEFKCDDNIESIGMFDNRKHHVHSAVVSLLFTFFILLLWLVGVTAFIGPVTTLIVIPIERMVRLLSILVKDPVAYSNNEDYKQFISEDSVMMKNSSWTKDVLNGMETSFLMSTILRIGSLMKVGFGTAGVEIIRSNLQKSKKEHTTLGKDLFSIFMFCDIRQFTDATECLQEEVFVFTNRIAAVVHSICHAYGGSANKNIGDAFLLSWRLDTPSTDNPDSFVAEKNEADKALLSVIKISIALHYDDFFLEGMSEAARGRLKAKFSKRPGHLVKVGFGLHAGKSVEGAIGSHRKLDATYVSNEVELAEFLESSTKTYGVVMLLSGQFYQLLHPSNQRRCRIIDQVRFEEDSQNDELDYGEEEESTMDLYTYDIDVEAIWTCPNNVDTSALITSDRSQVSMHSLVSKVMEEEIVPKRTLAQSISILPNRANNRTSFKTRATRRMSMAFGTLKKFPEDFPVISEDNSLESMMSGDPDKDTEDKLVLPNVTARFKLSIWAQEEMRLVRKKFLEGFLDTFREGYRAYRNGNLVQATKCFEILANDFNDGPSQYYLKEIEKRRS